MCHIHHTRLRPAVSEGDHLRKDNWMPDSDYQFHRCFYTGPMMESKVFICPSAAELQQWLQHLEDRRYKSMTQSMSPSQCALSYLVRMKYKPFLPKRNLKIYMYITVSLWWALEERRTKDILNASTHMAVGRVSHTAHGSTWIFIHGPCHQYTESGD